MLKYLTEKQVIEAYNQAFMQIETMIVQAEINSIIRGENLLEIDVLKDRLLKVEANFEDQMVQFQEDTCVGEIGLQKQTPKN